jgi:pimeloyl-ACP methyl ester carboxylesterase
MPIGDHGFVASAVSEVVDAHRRAGYLFDVDGVGSFAREQGDGPAVVLLHGVPSSSFLYRKMLPLLSAEGLRAIAFDFPGLGLADRPDDYDYSWGGLARFVGEALDALEVDRCHLVVHDIAGPIGGEWAVRNPERVQSLTVLNAMLDVATFRRPWSMRPFAIRGVGEVYLRTMSRFAFSELFYLQGVQDRSAVPRPEAYAYYELLKWGDGGRAFLRIMRGFELTDDKQRLLWDGLRPDRRGFPAQIVWGANDPALGERRRAAAQRALGVDDPILLPAKHFLQEDQAPAIAGAVAALARRD